MRVYRGAILVAALLVVSPAFSASGKDEAVNIKGHCGLEGIKAKACDSVTLIYPANFKDYVMVMFMQGTSAVAGFSGKTYFDPVDGDEKVMVDKMYSRKHTEHLYRPDGSETTTEKPEGWQPHEGVCEFSRKSGKVIAIDCGQPMWSFLVSPSQ